MSGPRAGAPIDEFEAEQAYLEHAYACLDRMRSHAVDLRRRAKGFGGDSAMELDQALARRAYALRESGRALCFGRIDADGGERWYVGRRHVEDGRREPVVVEWRTPVAAPFYQASHADPMGLRRRRHLLTDGDHLLSMADDVFGEPTVAGTDRLRGREALLQELDRARTGAMADIVATIQPDQYEIIRGPSPGLLFVQGGPGSGKTAVGLHRAAFLLYADEELARAQVLVVGPNRAFLRYIAQVLPSLGEAAVVQITLADLVGEARPVATEPHDVERVKGDPRMAAVLARAVGAYRRPAVRPVEVGWGVRRLVLAPADVDAIVARVVEAGVPYATGRHLLREKLVAALRDLAGSLDAEREADLRRDPVVRHAVDEVWPPLTPGKVVAELLSPTGRRLAGAAHAVLDASEQRLLRRRRSRAWTPADGPLVDEVRALLTGPARTYGHVVVDEAQDLSPMQLRMLARRCPSGSMTLLGDLAQGTGVWAHDRWLDLAAHLPAHHGVRIEELELGYRAPAQVLAVANRLLPSVAPGLRPTVAVRDGRSDPAFLRAASPAAVPATAAAEARRLTASHRSVAVIVPEMLARAVAGALRDADLRLGDALLDGLERPVTLVRAADARGLEFDAVVVVEPAAIVLDAARGTRLLYVVLTRPTQHLSVVHHEPLPVALRS